MTANVDLELPCVQICALLSVEEWGANKPSKIYFLVYLPMTEATVAF